MNSDKRLRKNLLVGITVLIDSSVFNGKILSNLVVREILESEL